MCSNYPDGMTRRTLIFCAVCLAIGFTAMAIRIPIEQRVRVTEGRRKLLREVINKK